MWTIRLIKGILKNVHRFLFHNFILPIVLIFYKFNIFLQQDISVLWCNSFLTLLSQLLACIVDVFFTPEYCRGLFSDNNHLDCAFICNASSELPEPYLVASVRLNTISPVPVIKLNATFSTCITAMPYVSFALLSHFNLLFEFNVLSLSLTFYKLNLLTTTYYVSLI